MNNGIRVADAYATERNPSATFIRTPQLTTSLDLQLGGEHEGRFLLTLVQPTPGGTSYAQLLPLFDENALTDELDDEVPLWQVVLAKFDGREF